MARVKANPFLAMLQRIARQDPSCLALMPPCSPVGLLCSLWLLPGSNCMLLSELSFSDCRWAPSSPSHFGFDAFPAVFAFGCLCRLQHVLSPHVTGKCLVCQVILCFFLFVCFFVLVFFSNFTKGYSCSPVELCHFGVSFIPAASSPFFQWQPPNPVLVVVGIEAVLL